VGQQVDLILDPIRGDRLTIELPLSLRTPVETVRRELEVPSEVDLSDPIVAKAVALAGAARRSNPPVRFALFGGTAHRLRCSASNDRGLGLRHELHDMDLAILRKEMRPFQRFLSTLGEREGSALTFFETAGDRIFNSLSDGQRLRQHMVVEQRDSGVVLGTLDIVVDEFRFCHRLDVRPDVEHAAARGWTLSPAHLLLAKSQFILRIPDADAGKVGDRVLEPFGRHELVIGPEPKDVQDILALIHDHAVGEGPGEISRSELVRLLGSDWGFWKTVGLNLALVARSPALAGLPAGPRAHVTDRLQSLRQLVASLSPRRRLAFLGGPWWQEDDSIPSVDSTVGVPDSG